uniref:Uncharacterized protein n=1 Tax=viral metagenome TaxID=1070528 RepID=A0A6C0ADZ9_9ZZZZ
MLKLKYKKFPEYLKESDLYKNLSSKDSIYIPEENFKISDEVNSLEDFKQLFKTINFFGLDYPKQMKKYFDKNTEEVFYYYYQQIDEINIFFMLKYFFGSEEKLNSYFENKIKKKLDELINYLNDKEKKSKKEYKFYEFYGKINLKSKLKKKYVEKILGILNILKTQNFMFLKDYINSDIKEIKFENIKPKEISNLGYFLSLDKINSTLKITEKGCFNENLSNIEIIGYRYGGAIFNIAGKEKHYLDFEQNFGFILSLDEFAEPVKPNIKNIFWFSDNNTRQRLPILNIYFSTNVSLYNYIRINKKLLKTFGDNEVDYRINKALLK